MTSAKKTSSNSKLSTPSKKTKVGSPIKKKSSSQSQNKNSPKKSNRNQRTGGSSKHPGYQRMVTEAITTLNSRTGSSRAKILNHIKSTYGLDSGKSANTHLRAALEALLKDNVVSLAKGTGYSNGYFRIAAKGKKSSTKRSSSPKKKTTKIIIITKSITITKQKEINRP